MTELYAISVGYRNSNIICNGNFRCGFYRLLFLTSGDRSENENNPLLVSLQFYIVHACGTISLRRLIIKGEV